VFYALPDAPVTATYGALVDSDLRTRPIAIGIAAAITVLLFFAFFGVSYVVDEEICLDRVPPWGPPKSGWDEECSGHWYQRHHKP